MVPAPPVKVVRFFYNTTKAEIYRTTRLEYTTEGRCNSCGGGTYIPI